MAGESEYNVLYERLRESPKEPDSAWLAETARQLFSLTLCVEENPIEVRDDGFPYFVMTLMGEQNCPFGATVEGVLDYLIQNRVGIEFLTPTGFRFWYLPFGSVLAWRIYGTPNPPRFWNLPPDVEDRQQLTEIESIWVGQPNEEMLPPSVRDVLRWAMREQLGIAEPRVGLIRRERDGEAGRLVLSLDPEHFGGEEQCFDAYKFLLWFVPPCIPTIHMPTSANSAWMTRL